MAKIHRLLPLLLLSAGCNKLFAKDTPAPTAEASDAPKAAASAKSDHGDHAKEEGGRFGVPFAWESSPEEPLAKARSFMAEVLKANETFMGQGREHFKPFVDEETPRATVLTCADSRVQSAAWDQNPENDDYTVRNLGNQLSTSLGSVQYGVDHLNTPVLLIIGHTGCDAVKAALEKDPKSKGPIADEIARIELPPQRKSKDFDTTWKNAVIANVNKQVEQAVAQFGNHVQAGDLTIVGAVYDFRDDLGDGHGRLHIVNVNSNVEEARLAAFEEAVQEVNKKAAAAASPFGKRTFQPFQAPAAVPLEHNQQLSPGARASVNALNMLASGSFPGLRPGMAIPGTVDLKAAPSFRPFTPTRTAPAHGAADEHAGHGDHEEKETESAADHGKAAAGHGTPTRKKASTAHAAPAAGHEAPDEHASEPASGHADAAEPDSHDEDPHAPAGKTQPAARAAAAPTVQTGARAPGQTPLPSSAAGHAVAPAPGRGAPPTSLAPRAPVAPAAGARAVAPPRSGPPVSRPLTPMTGSAASPVASARSGPPRSGPPVSRPLTPATRYPAPAAVAPAASRQATPAPAVAPGRPATAPAAGGAAATRSAPAAGQARTPAAAPRTGASPAPAAPRATPPPQAGQRQAPAPGAAAPAPGAAAPARAAAPAKGTAPPAGKSPAAAPAPPATPPAPAAPKQPARPRLPMAGPVTAGPAGPEAEDAPPNRQKAPAAGRAKAGAPTAPAPSAPAKAAPGKAPAAPPPKTH